MKRLHDRPFRGTKGDFAALAQEATFVRFADIHDALHMSYTPT